MSHNISWCILLQFKLKIYVDSQQMELLIIHIVRRSKRENTKFLNFISKVILRNISYTPQPPFNTIYMFETLRKFFANSITKGFTVAQLNACKYEYRNH